MDKQKEDFLNAFSAGYGIILNACEAIGISRSKYYKWMQDDPDFAAKVEEIKEAQIDFVESKLISAIDANDTTAIIFYLKTKGKKRGYSEKMPQPAPVVIPATVEEHKEDDSKKVAAKLKAKKAYIVKLLKEQGKYTAELTYQVDITAKLLVRADLLGDEIFADGHKSVNVEYSREGNERVSVNPKEKLYIELLEKGQKALRALGMNTESKERSTDNDSFDDFLTVLKNGDD